ncbi:hypothetical protein EJ04DRAFT_525997 [Polyplosphaeria fusca]|uniref:Uncharacterized protein n=1 Tax=Polyplosphaeria fusca TaxID=682080 RepID=A0A9P4QUJ1_9PLEO|nr:hypothetical protein EJ04DRAFT_525997 [Polyplosphaeria fusca]
MGRLANDVFPLGEMYGIHYSGPEFEPLMKNILRGRTLTSGHGCSARGCSKRTRRCYEQLHQAFCQAPVFDKDGVPLRDGDGNIQFCGESFCVSSPGGCYQHSYSNGFNIEFKQVGNGIQLEHEPWYLKNGRVDRTNYLPWFSNANPAQANRERSEDNGNTLSCLPSIGCKMSRQERSISKAMANRKKAMGETIKRMAFIQAEQDQEEEAKRLREIRKKGRGKQQPAETFRDITRKTR